MEEGLIKKLMTSTKCSVCGKRYKADNVDVLGHEEDLWFLEVFCPACRTKYLVAAIIREERLAAVTDLSKVELEKFRKAGRLTANDVLDMHNFLNNFDGDFSQLFSQKGI